MLRLFCDRCESEYDNPELVAYSGTNPYANAFTNTAHADIAMPDRWQRVNGKHLCEKCVDALNDFLHKVAVRAAPAA